MPSNTPRADACTKQIDIMTNDTPIHKDTLATWGFGIEQMENQTSSLEDMEETHVQFVNKAKSLIEEISLF